MKKNLTFVLLLLSTLIFAQVKQKKMRIVENENGKKIEMEVLDNQVTALKIDGQDIPKEKFADHKKITDRLIADLNQSPEPPATPTIDNKKGEKTVRRSSEKVITTKKDGDNTKLIFTDETGKTTPLTVTKDGKILFEDTEMKDGAKIVMQTEDVIQTTDSDKPMEWIQEKNIEKILEEKSNGNGEKRKEMRKRVISESPQTINLEVQQAVDETWLGDALWADKLIEKKGNFDIDIDNKTLTINGKAQSAANHAKYKKLFESHGNKFTEKTKISINNSVD